MRKLYQLLNPNINKKVLLSELSPDLCTIQFLGELHWNPSHLGSFWSKSLKNFIFFHRLYFPELQSSCLRVTDNCHIFKTALHTTRNSSLHSLQCFNAHVDVFEILIKYSRSYSLPVTVLFIVRWNTLFVLVFSDKFWTL